MAVREGSSARSRGAGRPTVRETARLDHDVREGALRLFLERGYEGTSMDEIARAAGTTKASLYARFPSKDMVFSSVLEWAIQRSDWPFPEPALPDFDDLEAALTAIGRASLQRALDPSMVKLSRIAIAQASRFPEIAQRTHSSGYWPRQQVVAELLKRHAAAGGIVAEDPAALAEYFLGSVSGVPARLASFGIVRSPVAQERHMRFAVRLFLRALRPD